MSQSTIPFIQDCVSSVSKVAKYQTSYIMSCISQLDLWIFPALAVCYQQLEACGFFKDMTEAKAVFICRLRFRPGTKYCDVWIRRLEQLRHIIMLCFSSPKWTHGTWTAVAQSPGTSRPAASSMSKVPKTEAKCLWVYMWIKQQTLLCLSD